MPDHTKTGGPLELGEWHASNIVRVVGVTFSFRILILRLANIDSKVIALGHSKPGVKWPTGCE